MLIDVGVAFFGHKIGRGGENICVAWEEDK